MIGTIYIKGIPYHSEEVWDEVTNRVIGHSLIMVDGKPVLKQICMCYSMGPYGCICGAWDIQIKKYGFW